MALRPIEKRARLAWANRQTAFGGTLLARLQYCADARCESTSSGLVLVSASSAGSSSQRTPLPQGGATPQDLLILWQGLIELHDEVKAELVAAGDANPSDAEILVAMLASSVLSETHKVAYNDYYGLQAI